ncbi:MAG: hypothetical protein ACLP70_06150 [Streptosporangiaceae bacterium]
MRIPQVSDRMREAPVQALRATFASIGQLLLAADRLWSRSEPATPAGSPATAQQDQAAKAAAAGPGRQPQRGRPARKAATTQRGRPGKAGAAQRGRQTGKTPASQPSRWRSLDETGNVRLLSREDIDEELTQRAGLPAEPPAAGLLAEPAAQPGASLQIDDQAASAPVLPGEPGTVAMPESAAPESAAPESAAPEPAAAAEAAVVAESTVIAEPAAVPGPATVPAPAEVPGPAGVAESPAAPKPAAAPEPPRAAALPVPGYDGLSIASLRARLRNLDPAQLRVLADYERAGQARADVLTMFERRIAKLEAAG